ncbi:hypothetical protein GCM10023149_51200 [Mucilaginibacter gynuensis]|uniref:Uncharacterized protein n=1 Tax=Mucilaginibacter gynuensis TaxID=1302236 RepID=A0ABP8HJ36_9SPHI
MNWIISKSDKFDYHTNLGEIFKPLTNCIKDYNWLITDLQFISFSKAQLSIDHSHDYFLLDSTEFQALINNEIQFVWAVISALPKEIDIVIKDVLSLPYADGNGSIWESEELQHPDAVLEIICWDSGYTIVKFTDEELSAKFKAYFPEAVALADFR